MIAYGHTHTHGIAYTIRRRLPKTGRSIKRSTAEKYKHEMTVQVRSGDACVQGINNNNNIKIIVVRIMITDEHRAAVARAFLAS